MDPDPDWIRIRIHQKLDPDPDSNNPDPQLWTIGEGRFKMTLGKLLKIRKGIHLPKLKAKLDEKQVEVFLKT